MWEKHAMTEVGLGGKVLSQRLGLYMHPARECVDFQIPEPLTVLPN